MADTSRIGAALPDYDVGEVLGRGAWAVVYAGHHRALGRDVAIKQLPVGLASEPEARRRFQTEAKLLASLSHPHVLKVYDFVERDDLLLLVIERMAGDGLSDAAPRWADDPAKSCAVLLAVCLGLQHAHERGVLHRDIKPDNVLFSDSGVAKVADFGIAKMVGTNKTVDTGSLGSPAYMAPEQVTGGELSPATDIYSVGVMAYELLAGRLPFTATDATAALYQHVHEDAPPLADLKPSVPAAIADVVMRALARDPLARQQSAAEFAAELNAAAETAFGLDWLKTAAVPVRDVDQLLGLPVPARSTAPPVVPPAAAAARRLPVIPLAVAAAVVVALVAGFALTRGGGSENGASGSGFAIKPTSGRAGVSITATSKEPCPSLPEGWTKPMISLEVVDPNDPDVFGGAGGVAMTPEKPWRASVGAHQDLTAGVVDVIARCSATDPEGNYNSYFDYPENQPFEVVGD